MRDTVTLESVTEIPSDCRICDYDELGEEAKAQVPVLADETADASVAAEDESIDDAFADCDLVKYTDYYAVSAD